ncbi:MAG: winged helix-turn-helix domain-containing protein [Candidatus Omnitrophota bacterium]
MKRFNLFRERERKFKRLAIEEIFAHLEDFLREEEKTEEERKMKIGRADLLELNPVRHEVLVKGEKVNLLPVEFKILECLLSHRGDVLSEEKILDYIWGKEDIIKSAIDNKMKHLREKLGKAGNMVKHVGDNGYKLEEDL